MLNGNLKSLLLLWENLAVNRRYRHLVTKKDLSVFRNRATNEGLAFLTVTLPTLGKDLDTYHSNKRWRTTGHFERDREGIPRFLGRAIKSAINGNSVAVDCVRQLSGLFYKLEVPYDSEQIASFIDQFIKTDRDLGDIDYAASSPLHREDHSRWLYGDFTTASVIKVMRYMIGRVLANADPREIMPCHGAGATACRTPNHKKWSSLRYYAKLDHFYDYSTYFFLSATHVADELDKLENSETKDPVARVCLVPKDSRGPRIISCEPAELQYIQHGLMRLLYDHLENQPLTSGFVNFTDQRINQELARVGSLTNRLATLDLKDASDRVSLDLVKQVFPEDWVEALIACRSEETQLPDGSRIKLNKFAPMGSACCFPVEALVFWACAQATIHILTGRTRLYETKAVGGDSVSSSRLVADERMAIAETLEGELQPDRSVYVYGDDIICDSQFAQAIAVGLESIGLIVNRDKSYVDGPFRESCGGDYHLGDDVTPVRVRKWLSSVGTGLQAGADLANELIAKFGYESVHNVIRVIEDEVGYLYPRTLVELPVTIRFRPGASNDAHFQRRWNSNLQRYEHRVLNVRYDIKSMREPDWSELLRKQLTRGTANKARFPYENPLLAAEVSVEPGQYAVAHSARKNWVWAWLG